MNDTVVALRFPFGRYHATAWGRAANEAAVDWPPEPWRLLRALYSVWRTRAPDLDDDVVKSMLGALAAPPTYVVPPHRLGQTRHYMPDTTTGSDKVIDAFVAVDPAQPLFVRWPVELPAAQRDALATLCERMGYLGRAESVVEAALAESVADGEDGSTLPPLSPGDVHAGATQAMLAPEEPLDLNALTATTVSTRKGGRIDPLGSRRVEYALPEVDDRPPPRSARRGPETVHAVRYRLTADALVSMTQAVPVADAMRRAAIKHFDVDDSGAWSPTIGGRGDGAGAVSKGNRHAHFVVFTSDLSSYPRLDTVVVWATDGFEPGELSALVRIPKLTGYGFRPQLLGVEAFGPVQVVAPELCGLVDRPGGRPTPARRWQTFTPFAPPRHPRRRGEWETMIEPEVRRELSARTSLSDVGIGSDVDVRRIGETEVRVRAADGPLGGVPGGWMDFTRFRRSKGETRRDARPAFGVEIEFSEPVVLPHPLCIGALSHFGLGLFLPVE